MIKFSDHALLQSEKRKIPKKRIVETIKNPENVKSSFRRRKVYRRQYEDKMLEVVTVIEEDDIIIITQYYLY